LDLQVAKPSAGEKLGPGNANVHSARPQTSMQPQQLHVTIAKARTRYINGVVMGRGQMIDSRFEFKSSNREIWLVSRKHLGINSFKASFKQRGYFQWRD